MAAELEVTAESLLLRARADGNSAIGRLLEHYRNYLTLLARLQIGRRLQGKVDSADLVQETFLHAHRDFERFRGRTPEALAGWLREGKIKSKEDVVDGIENFPQALAMLFEGKNFGKRSAASSTDL